MTILIINIGKLVNIRENDILLRGKALSEVPSLDNAFLLIEDEMISHWGSMADLDILLPEKPSHVVDAMNGFVIPAWCDSHTHLVFAGSRESEFVDKIRGLTYAEIASRGGGILHSARKLQEASEDMLFHDAWARLQDLIALGTGAIEIKSGYGLTVDSEIKMLKVIKKLKEKSRVPIKATFLGAHTYPTEFKENHEGYLRMITEEMLPLISKEKLADYIDVFCENGFFSAEETERICRAGASHGLRPKLHVNQLNSVGGIEVGLRNKAVSLDHLETLTDEEIDLLSSGDVVSTLLPSAAFFLRMDYQPARKLIDGGAAIALASDYNPGSSPSGNMNLVASLSCIQMRMLPEEVINAGTVNGAFAMELQNQVGAIGRGKLANLILTKPVPSLAYLPYAFGSNLISKVMIRGEFVS